MLNPQRGDHIRCLLSYRRKKAVGVRGLVHLKRYIATMYSSGPMWDGQKKLDKMSVKRREKWTEANTTLLKIANDPFAHAELWQGAGEPCQFIKAVKVLRDVAQYGVEVETGLIAFVDAASSGTQHFSAISRSLFDGQLCNLTPNDEPANIYQVVADKAHKAMNDDIDGTDAKKAEYASVWASLKPPAPNIKSTKRNTMTVSYDSNVSGMADQLYEDVVKPLRRLKLDTGEEHPFPNKKRDAFKVCRYHAQINHDVMPVVLPSGRARFAF